MHPRRSVKSVLLYLECGHRIIAHDYKGQPKIECMMCNGRTKAKIIKHGIALERQALGLIKDTMMTWVVFRRDGNKILGFFPSQYSAKLFIEHGSAQPGKCEMVPRVIAFRWNEFKAMKKGFNEFLLFLSLLWWALN